MLSGELKKIVKGDVVADDATREKYSRDYSIFRVKPEIVVFPRDVDDLKNLVKFALKNKNVSLTGRSAGTDMTGGPLTESIVVEFTKYFNRIKEVKRLPLDATWGDGGYAVVEPGVYFRDFEKAIARRGLLYPPYPASKDLCAIGGMISNNSGGELTLQYGKTENYVMELKMVLSDGEEHVLRPLSTSELKKKIGGAGFEGNVYRRLYKLIENNRDLIKKAKPDVSKNSSGYALWNVWDGKTFDITKLFVGSQGTLGLITEAKLRLVKAKKYSRLAVVFLRSFDLIPQVVDELLKFKPEGLESYDDKTLSIALKFLPQIIKSMKGSFFKLIWQFLPEALMVLRGGLPKMVILAQLASDDEKELSSRMTQLYESMKQLQVYPVRDRGGSQRVSISNGIQARVLKNENEAQKYWTIRRQSFKLLHDNSTGKDTAPFIDDVIVRPKYLPEFLLKINAILDQYKDKLVYTIAGHPGDGNFHIIPLMDLKRPDVRAIIPEISDKVYKLVKQYNGSITAEHNDGLIRTPYLKQMYGPRMVALFAEVKKIFDPRNIFNPGKKVGGSLKYSLSAIKSAAE